ncbi:pyridoxal 5'-phosphate synthase glutaminase subunit PdxT [Oceanobacillus piezotolerans]|uniref:Pyridoxal 5'-phosphate synthase subunit PdxT n=1 Tax=Oceanobacillus piezotolerans TaxID=2448030 RepID=A0A498D938_9BACI|nr:pyridoxal 5'-phosphate synthase glutaminase subunit PdxT [Oceanobacillus piezotolerans]RLL40400.1 pyridoxal 5'-phosphate synthase glutaminase subunit PdxT [Oceanobacillus piezotolerans]
MRIGVLALQGAVEEHIEQIESLGAKAVPIKKPDELNSIDGLILPGGESTTMRRLIDRYHFLIPLQEFAAMQKPIFGTCAGMVLLAKEIADTESSHLGLMDIVVKRNAFGRQRESFEVQIEVAGFEERIPAVFIRAPYIDKASEKVEVLAQYEGHIVAARQGNLLVSSFHPELTSDTRFLQLFIDMVSQCNVVETVS